jgi:hypothetical protein
MYCLACSILLLLFQVIHFVALILLLFLQYLAASYEWGPEDRCVVKVVDVREGSGLSTPNYNDTDHGLMIQLLRDRPQEALRRLPRVCLATRLCDSSLLRV